MLIVMQKVMSYINSIPKIEFEGLDCSYKETNAKKLSKYLEENGYEVELVSFPRYESNASYFVEYYFGGEDYVSSNMNSEEQLLHVGRYFYLDMMDWLNSYISYLKDKDDYEKKRCVIFDRYIISMLYYLTPLYLSKRRSDIQIRLAQDSLFKIADQFMLPRADIVFKMNSDYTKILEKAKERGQKPDLYEQNTGYLYRVTDLYQKLWFVKYMCSEKPYSGVFRIDVLNKSEQEVFESIILTKGVQKLVSR